MKHVVLSFVGGADTRSGRRSAVGAPVLLALLSVVGPAVAQDIPRFDISQACRDRDPCLGGTKDTSDCKAIAPDKEAQNVRDEQGCVDNEETSRGLLEHHWSKVDPAVKARCLDRGHIAMTQPYQSVWYCVDTEMSKLQQERNDAPPSGKSLY